MTPAPAIDPAREWLAQGNTALARGDAGQAEAFYRQAVAANAANAVPRLNLAFACLETGNPQEARQLLMQALELRTPQQDIAHETHFLLARACVLCGDTEAALAHCEAAAAARPDFSEPIELGVQLQLQLGRLDAALGWAPRLPPRADSAPALLRLAHLLSQAGRHADALSVLERLLAFSDPTEALEARAILLFDLARPQEAIDQFEVVLARKGDDPDTLSSLAAALALAGRFEEAVERSQQALDLAPAHRNASVNQGRALIELLRVDEAAEVSDRAVRAHPGDAELQWNRGMANLLAGRLKAAWPDHEVRWRIVKRDRPTLGLPQWDGTQSLRGRTLLLLAEQGLGDAIQFLRFVPMLAVEAGRVLVQLPKPLVPLTLGLPPNCTVLREGEAFPPPDFELPMLSLPLAFGTTLASVPAPIPYLHADAARRAAWAERLPPRRGSGQRIGLVWSGNPEHKNDGNRSIALSRLHGLKRLPHQFVSLQPQVRDSDLQALADWPELKHFGTALQDFAETAAVIANLDLVISVDTSVAHLAGAMGAPVWVLLPHCPDWRWLLGRPDSPWYPTARLFRQPGRGAWDDVVQALIDALGPSQQPNPGPLF
jgi:tetratricopeptide (TPR) repeat protein